MSLSSVSLLIFLSIRVYEPAFEDIFMDHVDVLKFTNNFTHDD